MKTAIIILILSILVISFAFFIRNQPQKSQTMYVGPVTAECVGIAPKRCLQVKYHPDEDYQLFYDNIQSFKFIPGFNYQLEVVTQQIDNPPADTSSIQYQLVQIIDQKEAQYIMITNPTDHQTLNSSQPITISGTGRGLFEGNVIIQIEDREKMEIISQEATTMTTDEIGGEGTWTITLSLPISQNIIGGLKAISPSPKDGSSDISYSLPVTLSIKGGEKLTLENTNWQLQSFQDDTSPETTSQLIENTSITAQFDGVQVGGSSECNQYFAPYTTQANQIYIGPTAGTLKACSDPIMNQEQQYLIQLQSSSTYSIEGAVLTMFNDVAETILIFEAQQPITLENTPWQAQGINNGKGENAGVVTTATTPLSTALFENGGIAGNTGCNNYQGSYQVSGDDIIQISPLTSTRKSCSPELMEQEQQFLNALENSNLYQIKDDKLNIRQDQSTMVNFQVAE